MSTGYTGKILHVDLTRQTIRVETPEVGFYRKYVGGSAMGLYYILKEGNPPKDGLEESNVFTFMLSAPTGAAISGQSRMCANAWSPLVYGIGDSQCSGFFPAELKFAGFDGIIFTGRAVDPVYLWVHDGQAELRRANHLWGKTTSETIDQLKTELSDRKIEVAAIGPAGEQLSRLAAIMNMGTRANGRTGLGAVMGSKNLKAVVVRGQKKQLIGIDVSKISELAKWGAKELPNNPDVASLRNLGTAGVVSFQQMIGSLPTFNYNQGQFIGFDSVSGETMHETIFKGNDTCFACAVRCKRVVETEWLAQPVEKRHGGPEYETIGTFGSYCGVDDIKAVAYANKVCNEFGLDTIGTGATIAWAMECFENGVLSEKEIGGPLHFGDPAAMTRLVNEISRRKGFGAVLADGSERAAKIIGKGREYLITVKGGEVPAHMPQAKRSLALIYAVNAFGPDHQSHEHDPAIETGAADLGLQRLAHLGFDHTLAPRSLDEEKINYARKTQIFYSFLDTACLCQFVWGPAWHLFGPLETVAMMQAVTGWQDFSLEELMQIGERRLNMLRLANARRGLGSDQDTLPEKFFAQLKGTGPTAGIAIDRAELAQAKRIYYRQCGWDEKSGLPGRSKLVELGLDWVLVL